MEITDILKPQSSNYNMNRSAIAQKRENNKFRELVEKAVDSGAVVKKTGDNKRPIDKKLMDTCIEMESIFVSKMLKEMRNTLPKEKLIDGGYAEEIFEDMLYDQYALSLSKTSNLGLANMIYKELSGI